MKANVHWQQRMSFEGLSDSGFSVPMGSVPEVGGDNDAPRPMELILLGLGGCTGMDVISILQKKKQQVTSFDIRLNAERAGQHPKVFTAIEIEYIVRGKDIDPAAVERAVQLSAEKYCPAQAMLGQIAPIKTKITIENEV